MIKDFKPTSRELSAGVWAIYEANNLLPGDWKIGVQSVYKVSEPTSRKLSALVQPFNTVSKPTSKGCRHEVQFSLWQNTCLW